MKKSATTERHCRAGTTKARSHTCLRVSRVCVLRQRVRSVRTWSLVTPEIATRFRRPRSPLTIRTARRGRRSEAARKSMRASFAAPSTGGAATRTTNAPPRSPAASVFFARGTTRIAISRLSNHLARRRRVGGGGLELDLLDEARTVQDHPLFALARFLLADELERVAQRLDARLVRYLDVLALELEAVDLALDVLQTR